MSAPKFHEIAVVVEIRSLDNRLDVKPVLRAVVADISGTGLEMSQAKATAAALAIQKALTVIAGAVVGTEATKNGLGI